MTKMNKKFRITFAVVFICALTLLFSSFFPDKEQTLQSIERGGVVITFDDYYVDDWYAANQILGTSDWKATFFVAEFHTYNQEEIDKLRTLQSQGHEVALHGKNHINALEFSFNYPLDDYLENEILPPINAMEQEGFDISSFAYPFGAKIRPNIFEKVKMVLFSNYMDTLDKLLLEHFDILRGTTYSKKKPSQQRNYANGTPVVFGLGIDDSYNIDTEYLLSLLQHARDNDKIVIFYGHQILPDTQSIRYATHIETLKTICEFVAENDMHFLTMGDLVID